MMLKAVDAKSVLSAEPTDGPTRSWSATDLTLVVGGLAALVASLIYRLVPFGGTEFVVSAEGLLDVVIVGITALTLGLLRSYVRANPDRVATSLAVLLDLTVGLVVLSVIGSRVPLEFGIRELVQSTQLAALGVGLLLAFRIRFRWIRFSMHLVIAAFLLGSGTAISFALRAVAPDAGQAFLELTTLALVGVVAAVLVVRGFMQSMVRLQLVAFLLITIASADVDSWLRIDRESEIPSQKLLVLVVVGLVLLGTAFELRDTTLLARRVLVRARTDLNHAATLLAAQRSQQARLSHDARNALLAIHGGLRAIEVDDGTREIVLSIDSELDRLQGMIERYVPPPVRFSPIVALSPMLTCYQPADHAIRVVGDDEILALASPAIVVEIVQNLIENAIRHSLGATIDLTIDEVGDQVVISVSDRGRGIAPLDLTKVFEPGVSSGLGTGHGLAISRALAFEMDGSLTASRRVGGGSTFSLTLPNGGRRSDHQLGYPAAQVAL